MMSAGVPMVQAFDIVGRGHNNPSMAEMILATADVEGGTSLTASLRKHPLYFDDLFCNLVEAGEQAGVLETLLDKIATCPGKTESLKAKIKKAVLPDRGDRGRDPDHLDHHDLRHPAVQDLFSSFGADLPAFTRMVITHRTSSRRGGGRSWAPSWARWSSPQCLETLAQVSRDDGPPVAEGAGDRPRSCIRAALARFCRTTATMFTRWRTTGRGTCSRSPVRPAVRCTEGGAGNAVTMSRPGDRCSWRCASRVCFTHMVIQMVTIGEESGALTTCWPKVADFYEEEVDNAVDALSSLLEPLIMVVLGTVIGGWSSRCTCRSSSWARSSPASKAMPEFNALAEVAPFGALLLGLVVGSFQCGDPAPASAHGRLNLRGLRRSAWRASGTAAQTAGSDSIT